MSNNLFSSKINVPYNVRTLLDEKEIPPLLDQYLQLYTFKVKRDPFPDHYFTFLQKSWTTSTIPTELLTPREKDVLDLLAKDHIIELTRAKICFFSTLS